jgi:hypothetical protein
MRKTFDWFHSFDSPALLFNKVALINETPNPDVHKYWCVENVDGSRDRAWTADQGVFLFSLLKLITYEPSNSARYKNLLTILTSLQRGFFETTNTLIGSDNVLREFDFDVVKHDDNNSNFNNNYCTGPGVFMRYLAYAYPMIADAKLSNILATTISASAVSAWNSRDWIHGDEICCWYEADLRKTKYWQYYDKDVHDKDKPGREELWHLAFQAAALDLFVALLRLYR